MQRWLFRILVGGVWFFALPFSLLSAQPRDGKLLRSELWQPFDARAARGDFFVSPQGDDRWSGTLGEPNAERTDGPFATLARAQRAVRELKARVYLPKGKAIDARYVGTTYPFGKGKDIVVFLRQGYYTLSAPLIFTPEDGGERVETNLPSGAFEWHHLRDNYVTYAAYPGEKPVLSGARPVTGWNKGEGQAWKASFPEGEVPALLADGRKQTLARTPNQGYYTLRTTPASTSEIPFKPGEIRNWPDMQENRIAILLRWRTAYNRLARVDEGNQVAYLQKPEDGPDGYNGLLVVPPRYYLENVKALLDAPGEWFFDKISREIHYIPPDEVMDPNRQILAVPQATRLMQIRGEEGRPVRNLRFYGLIFEGAKENFRDFPHYYDPTPGCVAITWEYAQDCEFAQSELRACGGVGMSLGLGCVKTRIFGNRFDGLEQGALSVSGTSDLKSGRLSQITRETSISRNIFSRCGLGGGITLAIGSTLHTTIERNYFTGSGRPYTVNCGGGGLEGNINGDLVMEYNHFEDVQADADDAGVIVVNGMTFNSFIRNNLIHRVRRGFFSDNVAFWFDNMSYRWTVRNNIYYDLEQAEMKTCGTYLIDNEYADNFSIEAPALPPEQIIEGNPLLACSRLQLRQDGRPLGESVPAGSVIQVSAEVFNSGSSGVAPVTLFVDRRPEESRPFPVIRGNRRTIEFSLRLTRPGRQEISIGETRPQSLLVTGEAPRIVFDRMRVSEDRLLEGETVRVSALASNLQSAPVRAAVLLYSGGKELQKSEVDLQAGEKKEVTFDLTPPAGDYRLKIGNSEEAALKVFRYRPLAMRPQVLQTYISPKAKPAEVTVDPAGNRYIIKASGWDFYHAEDAYATVYYPRIRGDFVATVKIASFGSRTNDWYRAGLFVRNDIRRSFDVERGSKGSVLMFSTPGRAGIEWDEFGDGCMHKASSENLPENSPTPIWIRLERHGNRFTGSISLDGRTWIIHRQTGPVPGIAEAVDLGLAAGAPDQKQYTVEFADWEVRAAEEPGR